MIIAYRIKKIFRRIPAISVLFALLLIFVYWGMPFLRAANIEGGEISVYLHMNNGINPVNLIISGFTAENFYQLILYIWLISTVCVFVESHYGNLTFLLLYLLFYVISGCIGMTPLYSTTIPFPICQAVVLMFAGFIVSTDTKVRADVFYMFFPVEHGYGKFDYPANVIFLPSYFIWQCIALFFTVIFVNRHLMPTDGNAVNLFLCPPIGILVGILFKNVYKKYNIEKIMFETGDGKANYNSVQMKGTDLFLSGKYEKALDMLLEEFSKTQNLETVHFIIESYMRLEMKKDAVEFVQSTFSLLRTKNDEAGLYSLYAESKDADLLFLLNPEILSIIARMLHRGKLFEETREVMYYLYKNHADNERVINLKEYFDNIGFN